MRMKKLKLKPDSSAFGQYKSWTGSSDAQYLDLNKEKRLATIMNTFVSVGCSLSKLCTPIVVSGKLILLGMFNL